jgi:hypothetical protein
MVGGGIDEFTAPACPDRLAASGRRYLHSGGHAGEPRDQNFRPAGRRVVCDQPPIGYRRIWSFGDRCRRRPLAWLRPEWARRTRFDRCGGRARTARRETSRLVCSSVRRQTGAAARVRRSSRPSGPSEFASPRRRRRKRDAGNRETRRDRCWPLCRSRTAIFAPIGATPPRDP